MAGMEEAGMNAEAMRQWIVLALLGEEITAQEAARRLSIVEKAEQAGISIPDIRTDFHNGPGQVWEP